MIFDVGRQSPTIVAVGSPPGRAYRGLIRMSGPESIRILQAWTGGSTVPRHVTSVRLTVPGTEHTLPALVLTFVGPRSFTGEDMAEVQIPGNPSLLDRFVKSALGLGARLAEPGEFTFRAFLAGKIDLTQAEGVAATIAATSDSQLAAASLLREGALGKWTGELVDGIATQLALVEAGIDFVDQDDVVPIGPGRLHDNLVELAEKLDQLLSTSRSWGQLEALPSVVMVGSPSTGKSTLFNALLGRNRAVISATPGTTRDVLTEPMRGTDGQGRTFEFMLTDIAGLDRPESALDRLAQAAARSAIAAADLLLLIDDGTSPIPSGALVSMRPGTPTIRVRTKSDLLPKPSGVNQGTSAKQIENEPLLVSSLTGEGLAELRVAIDRALATRGVSIQADMLALGPRHENALRAASCHMHIALGALAPQRQRHSIEQTELVASALREALNELACLGGRMTPDDIIGRVFATFCVGK